MDPDRLSVVYDIKRRLRKGHAEDVFSQFMMLGGYSAGAAFLMFALHITMARMLGPESYAAYGTYVAILFTVFFVLTSIHLVITRFVSYHKTRFQYEQINYLISSSLRAVFMAGLVFFLVLLLLGDTVSAFFGLTGIGSTVVLGFVLWFTMMVPVFEGAFKGLDQFEVLGKLRVIEAVMRLVFAVALVWIGFDVAGALFGLGLGTFIALTFTYKHIHQLQRLKSVRPNMDAVRRFAVPVFITTLCVGLLLNLDIILVKHYFLAADAGLFAAASLIAKLPFLLSMVFVSVMFPKITQLHADGKSSSAILRHALHIIVPFVAVFTLLSFFFARPLFTLLFGSAYAIGPVLGFYVFGMGCLSVSVLLAVYLLALKKDTVAFMLPLFVLGYIVLLLWMHNSLLQVIIISMLINAATLAYTLYSARNEIDFDYFL